MKIDLRSEKRRLKAFTLIELIIVIAIITVLAMIAVPNTIQMMRSSRIEAANTQAKEIHAAVQNFVTDQQIKNKKLCNTSSEKNGVFPSLAVGANKDKVIFCVIANASGTYVYDETVTPAIGSLDTSDTDRFDKEVKIIDGIKKYLGSAFDKNGSERMCFAAQVDVNTYTVDFVVSSDQKNAEDDIFAIMFHYNTNHTLYQQIYQVGTITGQFMCQEYDVNHFRDADFSAYIGQYPIPYGGQR